MKAQIFRKIATCALRSSTAKPNIIVAALLLASCGTGGTEYFLASSGERTVALQSFDDSGMPHIVAELPRGTAVTLCSEKGLTFGGKRYAKVEAGRQKAYVAREALVRSAGECVSEKRMFVRTPASVISDPETSCIGGLAGKGDELTIEGYDSLCPDGSVYRYRVSFNGSEGYVYGKYLVHDRDMALERYMADVYDPIHRAVKNPFNGGEAAGCDFYPVERPGIEGNVMPESCYSLYLTSSPIVLDNIEAYISLAKRTKINTFVITVKDNESPGYKAEAMKRHSPTSYEKANEGNAARYEHAVRRLHEEGFYVVGRITCFKDSYYVADHIDAALTDLATGAPFKYNKAYWPSAYDRKVWQYNIELAKETVRRFGFDEINLDYVRFPELSIKVEKEVNYRNAYSESKVQAIQRFVAYACDEIHAAGAYVSVDVFGESANPGYTTAYGQYWPALSNVADVMCGMPYPDHFSNGYYGITKPWNHPYELLSAWGRHVQQRQAETPTPARVRTWVQAYNVMRFVDPNGIAYDAENVEKEIRALFDAGLTGGYMPWMSSANINKYEQQEAAFNIDYLAEKRGSAGK